MDEESPPRRNPARKAEPRSAALGWYARGEADYTASFATAAQARLPEIQGARNTWFCGAWTRYGFHEDGFASALEVARALDVEPLRQAA